MLFWINCKQAGGGGQREVFHLASDYYQVLQNMPSRNEGWCGSTMPWTGICLMTAWLVRGAKKMADTLEPRLRFVCRCKP